MRLYIEGKESLRLLCHIYPCSIFSALSPPPPPWAIVVAASFCRCPCGLCSQASAIAHSFNASTPEVSAAEAIEPNGN
jgi:hypothetical protein